MTEFNIGSFFQWKWATPIRTDQSTIFIDFAHRHLNGCVLIICSTTVLITSETTFSKVNIKGSIVLRQHQQIKCRRAIIQHWVNQRRSFVSRRCLTMAISLLAMVSVIVYLHPFYHPHKNHIIRVGTSFCILQNER